MNIGEAAARSGVSAKMIRHYESIGLPRDGRTAIGCTARPMWRCCASSALRATWRFRWRTSARFWRDRARASADVKRMAMDHLAGLEAKAAALHAMAESLRHLAARCLGDDRPECFIIDGLE